MTDEAAMGNPITVTVTRTDYAPGVENLWKIDGRNTSTYARSIPEALLWVRVIMERIENEQVYR